MTRDGFVEMMGHADLSMLRRHYAKIGGDIEHLRNAIEPARRIDDRQSRRELFEEFENFERERNSSRSEESTR